MRIRISPLVIIVALSLAAAGSDAVADDEKPDPSSAPTSPTSPTSLAKVGVVIAVGLNFTTVESALLSDELGKALIEQFAVSVVSGEAARALLGPDELPDTCISDATCLERTAATLGVGRLLLLVAVRTGDTVQVDATDYAAADKTLAARPTVRMSDKLSEWKREFARAAPSLLPGAPARTVAAETGESKPIPAASGGSQVVGPIDRDNGSKTHVYLFGVAAASFAVGAGLGLYSFSKCEDKSFPRGKECGDISTTRTAADIGMAVGVALGVVGLIVYLSDDGESKDGGLTVRSGPGDIGVAVGGCF